MNCLQANLAGCEMLIVSGSLPPGIPAEAYAGMIELARRSGRQDPGGYPLTVSKIGCAGPSLADQTQPA